MRVLKQGLESWLSTTSNPYLLGVVFYQTFCTNTALQSELRGLVIRWLDTSVHSHRAALALEQPHERAMQRQL